MPSRYKKGAAAIEEGPQTIGGAIQMQAYTPPERGLAGLFQLKGGSFGQGLGHARLGYGHERFGVGAEVVHLRAEGFKTLPDSDETGFHKTEVLLKARLNNRDDAEIGQRLEGTFAYANERSRETYLGITDADFQIDPNQRYAASREGLMRYRRLRGQLRYRLRIGDQAQVQATLYTHDFERSWRKLNGFESGPSLFDVFLAPEVGNHPLYLDVLRGVVPDPSIAGLRLGTNDRRYVSQGIDLRAQWGTQVGKLINTFKAGLRLHHDQVQRDHREALRRMEAGWLVPLGEPETQLADELGQSLALAGFVKNEFRLQNLSVVPGLRVEWITQHFEDFLADSDQRDEQWLLSPGLGLHLSVLDQRLGLFAGAHRGVSPKSPGQPQAVQPESAWNYELGFRSQTRWLDIETAGFVSHYQRITAECTVSSGCLDAELGRQYNSGEALLWGAEVSARSEIEVSEITRLELQLNYTLSVGRFLSGFQSQFPGFGSVQAGDALPYIPQHQGHAQASVQVGRVRTGLRLRAQSGMYDRPAQGALQPGRDIPGFAILSLQASYRLSDRLRASLHLDNLSNSRQVVSRRPFGARPNAPFSAQLGLRYEFAS